MIEFRENSYFNDKDQFLYYDNGIGKFFVGTVSYFNGNWYSDVSLKHKMTSVKSINCNNLKLEI